MATVISEARVEELLMLILTPVADRRYGLDRVAQPASGRLPA